MSDYNSSLPVRTETAGDIDINISDAVTPSQKLVVESDGSINVNAAFSPGTKVRLTDGVEDSEINASGELQVRDDDANVLLGTIDADTSSIATDASTIAGDTTSIDGKTPSLGAAVTAVSVPVNIASDQTVPVSAASLPLPTGAATAANQLPDGHNVTIDNAAGVAAVNIQDGGNSITVDATDLDVRDLTSVSDSVEVLQDTHDDLNVNANLQVGDTDVANGNPVPMSDAGGSITVDDGGSSITVDGAVTVSATDLDIRDLSASQDNVAISDGTDTLAINTDGSINVKVSDTSGTEILDYDTAAAVASSATDNHDYTTTGAFRLTQILASASSKMKIEVQVETAAASGTFNTIAVEFNSTANPNMAIQFKSEPLVASGARVRIIRTNRDNQAQDLYSTVLGYNV